MSPLDQTIPPAPGRRRPKPVVCIAAALILVALIAGTVGGLAAHADSADAQNDPSISEPEPAPTATPTTKATHHKPKPARTKKPADPTPPPTYGYTSCDQVWLGGQGPFKKGEPGYTKQLDPDGDGIACPSHP